jgi:hypothetical protein
MIRVLLILMILCSVFRINSFSQEMYFSPITSFNEGVGTGYSIAPTTDGGYIGVGSLGVGVFNSYILIFRINANGSLQWYNATQAQGINIGYKIIPTNDNNFLIVARIAEAPSGFPSQPIRGAYFTKINAQGDIIWENTYSEEGATYLLDGCQAINNDFYFAGNNFGDGAINTSDGAWVIKSNSDGDTLWTKTLETNVVGGYSVVPSFDSGCILSGVDHFVYEDTASGSSLSYQNPSPTFIKLDQQGNRIWQNYIDTTINGTLEDGITIDGYTSVFAGYCANINGSVQKAFLASIDEFGDTLWTKTIEGITSFYSISLYENENAFVCGGYFSNGNGSIPATAKFDFNGNLIWKKVYTDIPNSNVIWGVHSTPDGGVIATGKYSGNNNGILILKTNNQGEYSSVGLDVILNDLINKIKVFPNPVISKLNIDMSGMEFDNLKTEIYNSEGRLIKETSFQKQKLVKLELSEIPTGLYNLRLIFDNKSTINKKIVKK